MKGVAGSHSRERGEEGRSFKGFGIMEDQKEGRRMVGVERKRVCGAASAKVRVWRQGIEESTLRQEAGVRRIWRRKVGDSMSIAM